MQIPDHFMVSPYPELQQIGDISGKGYVILLNIQKQYTIVHCNAEYTQLTNYTYEELIGKPYDTLMEQGEFNQLVKELVHYQMSGNTIRKEILHYRKNESPFYTSLEVRACQHDNGEWECILLLMEDIHIKKILELQQKMEQQMFAAIELGQSFDEKVKMICDELDHFSRNTSLTTVMIKTDHGQLRTMTSDCYSAKKESGIFKDYPMTPLYSQAMSLRTPYLIDVSKQEGFIEDIKNFALSRQMDQCCHIPIINQQHKVIGLIEIFFQYQTQERSRAIQFFERVAQLISLAYSYSKSQQRIQELAAKDAVTGLANRQNFITHLSQQIEQGQSGFVKLLQPSEFANIVELYGHRIGDTLLRQIADRLNNSQNFQRYTIARFSDSTIIVSRVISEHEIMNYDECVNELLSTPFMVGDKYMFITLKMGVALFTAKANAEEVVRHADIALSYAKKQPGTHLEIFTEERSGTLERQMEVLHHLTKALNRQEIEVHLQPKVSMKNGKIVGLEALARWFSPELGRISPLEFIAVAESAGKIREIDLQVFESVLKWIQRRQRAGKRPYPISVNVSPSHFYHPTFVENMCQLVRKYFVDPREIVIEVTESIGLEDLQKAFDIINRLKQFGFQTSVDDFGIGFSSLSYLQKLPFNELKIDQSFVHRLHEAGTEAVVRAIIQLAHTLEMDVVAEGVETKEQEQQLLKLGCSIGQGYKYYKPIAMNEIDAILK